MRILIVILCCIFSHCVFSAESISISNLGDFTIYYRDCFSVRSSVNSGLLAKQITVLRVNSCSSDPVAGGSTLGILNTSTSVVTQYSVSGFVALVDPYALKSDLSALDTRVSNLETMFANSGISGGNSGVTEFNAQMAAAFWALFFSSTFSLWLVSKCIGSVIKAVRDW